jgi:hypothetical protein
MRTLGFILLFAGLAWALISVPLYRGSVTATTSVSLEVLQGRESLSHEEVHAAFVRHSAEMKRKSWWLFAPAFVTFCDGLLLSRSQPSHRHEHTTA